MGLRQSHGDPERPSWWFGRDRLWSDEPFRRFLELSRAECDDGWQPGIFGSVTRRSKVRGVFEVSRGLVTVTPTLSRQVPYALHMHDGVTSSNAHAEA